MWIIRLHRSFFLYHNNRLSNPSHYIHRFSFFFFFVVVDVSNLINNILFLADVKNYILSLSTDAGAAFSTEGLTRPKKKAPSPSFFSLCNVNLYFSSHRKASPGEQRGGFLGQLDVLEYNAISRWYSWKSSRYFPVWRRYSPLSSLSAFCIPFESVW